jgi:hypothetical protein
MNMLVRGWTKSSRSGHNGACVEARPAAVGVEVRDSKDVTGPTLLVSQSDWVSVLSVTRR